MITVTMQILSQYRDYNTMSGNIQASPAQWDSLYGMLAQDDVVRGYNVILNQNGEMLDRDPADVAATVRQRTGGLQNVWVDYCVWPMRHRSGPLHFFLDNPRGFAEFIRALNPLMAVASRPSRETDELGFQPPYAVLSYPDGVTAYPYKKGLSVNENLGRSPWADDGQSTSGWLVNDQAPSALGERLGDFPQYTYSCFAFRYGSGYYFYAYGAGVYANHGVDPGVYAEFIRRVLAGQTGSAPDGGIIGPPAPPPFIGPPPVDPPTVPPLPPPLDPGAPPPGTQPPTAPGTGGATWWAGLSQLQQAAVIGGGAAILTGAVLLMYQAPAPGRSEG